MRIKKHIAILAIVTFSFCLANASRAEIEVKVDRFTGETTVQTKMKLPVKRPHFDIMGTYTGEAQRTKPGITIMLVSKSEGWRYLGCNTTHWLVDDKPFELPQPIFHGEVGMGYVLEFLIIHVSLSAIQQMAAAKKVEFKVCNDEVTLNNGEMEDLRKFVGIFEKP